MSIRKPAPAAVRVRRSPEASRDNILAAAETLLVEKGPQALKLADVAAAAGVANATVLHHFASIDGVHAALAERLIQQLVSKILAAASPADDAIGDTAIETLFDTFEEPGAARLAAWLELTGESKRLAIVRQAVQTVVANRLLPYGLTPAKAENLVLLSVVLAMGAGLFGRTLSSHIGKPPDRARKLAIDLLRAHIATLAD
jgi:AcrR family transcriptional regulator